MPKPDTATARRNAILDALSQEDLQALLLDLELVDLTLGDVLYVPGEPVAAVHFPLVGVVSIVVDVDVHETVEAATVGREGMVGLSVFLGAGAASERAVVQVAGRALRMSAGRFVQEMDLLDGPLQAALRHYTQGVFSQLARNAACNRVHSVRQRVSRWLLLTSDHMGSPTFDLTQEFLARMLTVRRASVNGIAQALAEDGCITYSRGTITILDTERLHANACDCYDVIRSAAMHFTTTDTTTIEA